jgi:2-keto-4-pentenoate hydratase/2-oxohepta-3-ene-1,7-dioic acid hydratase in catechol pathway
MKLALYHDNGLRSGVISGDSIIDTGLGPDMKAIIADWPVLQAQVAATMAAGGGRPLADVRLAAPVNRPGKVFAIGLNYADHIAESKMETPKQQVWFSKAVTSVNGPFDPILIARHGTYVDYEAELVAVVGKGGRNIAAADAYAHIFGYCTGNDVTERMWQHGTPQWTLGKSFDTHAPIGPWITTADDVDPHDLDIRCWVNGELRQHSNTRHLVFNIWQQIEHLSRAMTLEPGDLIFTGTPAGIGAAMDPRRFLAPGDVVRVEIEQLGAIEGTLVAEA